MYKGRSAKRGFRLSYPLRHFVPPPLSKRGGIIGVCDTYPYHKGRRFYYGSLVQNGVMSSYPTIVAPLCKGSWLPYGRLRDCLPGFRPGQFF